MAEQPTMPPENVESAFIAQLEKLKREGNRGALATLRRTLIDSGRDFRAYTVVGAFLPAHGSQARIDTFVLVAGLYALHPMHHDDGTSIGTALRRLRSAITGGESSLDLLVAALLDAEEEDVRSRIRHVVLRLASAEIPLDYAQLLRDLQRWSHPRRFIQKRWARDYWAPERDADRQPSDSTAAAAV
jgi:CRISPR system Cascade subunit CasB